MRLDLGEAMSTCLVSIVRTKNLYIACFTVDSQFSCLMPERLGQVASRGGAALALQWKS